ncbi:PI-PLC X domain-containing protein 3-like isoform X1 [Branchiostoma floridae x Branchiostoma japonicum]
MSNMAADRSPGLDDGVAGDLHTRFANWMADLPPNLHTAPLKDLAIPGTHDSFSFFLDKTSDISPGEPPEIKAAVMIMGQAGKDLVYRWSVTQDICFMEQLNDGVRYFDFRVAGRKSDSSLYFVHGLYGSKVESALLEIAQYLNTHPKEVVLLDFNHFYSMVDFHHERLIAILKEMFGPKLCPRMDPADVTLATLWDRGQQVIVFYHNSVADRHINLWTGEAIVAPWANTPEITALVEFLNTEVREESKFYVSQGVLTPTAGTILGNLNGSLKDVLATPVMPHILKWLNGRRPGSGSQGVNIIIADFVDLAEFLPAVINLNYKETL